MLVIARSLGQMTHFILPDGRRMNIRVHRIEKHAHKVRLAIDAPADVVVVRDDAIKGARLATSTGENR